jgi:hypothetical protein
MESVAAPFEPTVVRRVFPLWSIRIPASFDEAFVHGDGYWHAWDATRSVSLTSVAVTERGRPVRVRELLQALVPLEGDPVANPPGLQGRAVSAPAVQPARATRMISGIAATDGRLLLATITGDDLCWTIATWLSIRHGEAGGRARARGPFVR